MDRPVPNANAHRPRVLFAEKVFLKRRKGLPLRGVELFNLALVRDLVGLGYEVGLPVTDGWPEVVRDEVSAPGVGIVHVADLRVDVITIWRAAMRLRGERHDVLLLANVGKSLLPFLRTLQKRRAFETCVVIAHREATSRFVQACRHIPGHVVAVNKQIAEPFIRSGHPSVHVDYGVTGAERFSPGPDREEATPMRFCVFGALDNAWKGADTAVAAFRRLQPDTQRRCELHLASFTDPPDFGERIICHAWMGIERVPEFLRRMDVMLVPSRDEEVMRETFSQAMVQGMLTGLPQLVSPLPILAEKLDRGGGMVCEGLDAWVAAMEQVAADPALRARLGREARRTALDRYVWDTARFADRYLPAIGGTGG